VQRLLTALVLCSLVSSCSSSNSPTTPGATPTPPVATRIIGLTGDLVFGDVVAGSTATRTFTIANSGNAMLTVSGMTAPSSVSSAYKSSWRCGTIAAGSSQSVTITFAPTAAITYNGTLTVNGDQTSGTNSLPFTGAGAASSRVTLRGVITSSAGARLSAITLRILDGSNAGRTATSTDGDYRFDDLAVGNANLSATGIGFAQLIKGLFINGATTLDFSLQIASAPPPSVPSGVRIGAICNDGSSSSATGSGACSHHGGVRCWRYSDGSCRAN